jgi:hypothetical protein
MSLTENQGVFVGVHEDGINDLLRAFFKARPRYLTYATPSLAPLSGSLSASPIAFEGTPDAMEYAVSFTVPTVDFHPDTDGAASPLPLDPGQVGIRTRVTLTVLCDGPVGAPISTDLDVFAKGTPAVSFSGPGAGEVSFQIDAIEFLDITPGSLESLLECVVRMVLRAVLSNVRLPFDALTAGFFSLALERGPESGEDQIRLYGDVRETS